MTASLQASGIVRVNYPPSLRSAVENAVSSWKEFCSLSKDDKEAFSFLEDSHGDGAGYEGARQDKKETFHATPFQYERLAKIANQRSLPFLDNAKALLDQIQPIVMQFARDVETTYAMPGFADEVLKCKPYWILRYLHYFGDQPCGTEIALPHADKGGFTLHLYESDEGLQYFCLDDRTWKPMPVSAEETVVISAMQLQLASANQLTALYHRVVANERTAKTGRFSMVCFVAFDHVPKYDKKRLGSIQGHQIGFNYDMPYEQFSTLFS